MHRVLLLGAGKIGSAISKFLASTGDFDVTVGDIDQGMLDRLPAGLKATKLRLDVSKHSELVAAMQGMDSPPPPSRAPRWSFGDWSRLRLLRPEREVVCGIERRGAGRAKLSTGLEVRCQ